MAVEVILPRVDMDMATGKFARWFAGEGERVAKGPAAVRDRDRQGGDGGRSAGVRRAARRARQARRRAAGRRPCIAWIVAEGEDFDADLPTLRANCVFPAPSASPAEAPARPAAPASSTLGRARPRDARGAPARARTWPRRSTRFPAPARAAASRRATSSREPPARAAAAPALAREARLNRLWLQRGQGAPLVFIHGFGADLNGWRPLRSPLADAACPRSPLDLPGHGGSPLSAKPASQRSSTPRARRSAEEGVDARASRRPFARRRGRRSARRASAGFRAASLMLIAPAGLGPEINWRFPRRVPARALGGEPDARGCSFWPPTPQSLGSALRRDDVAPARGRRIPRSAARLARRLFPDGVQAFSVRHLLADPAIPTKIVVGAQDQIIPPRHARD